MAADIIDKLKVFCFTLQDMHLCVELKYIDKVLPLMFLEVVPGCPAYLAGLMNLAGKSVPVIDLIIRLGGQRKTTYALDNLILLCSDEHHQIGMILDKVSGLADVETMALQMHGEFNSPRSPFLASVSLNNELSLLIDIPKLLTIDPIIDKNTSDLIHGTYLTNDNI